MRFVVRMGAYTILSMEETEEFDRLRAMYGLMKDLKSAEDKDG